jgi:hypothetical protein
VWQIWLESRVTYPISTSPEELAIYIEDKGYVQDINQFSPSELLGFLNELVKDNLTKSTQNCNTYFYAHWCDIQLRKPCSKVKILVGLIQAIPVLEIGAIKLSITNFIVSRMFSSFMSTQERSRFLKLSLVKR